MLKRSQTEAWNEIEGEHPVSATTTELTAWEVEIAVALASIMYVNSSVILTFDALIWGV